MSSPSRLTSGLATVPKEKPLGNYPYPDPFHTSGNPLYGVVSYVNDFFTIGSTTLDFTLTGTPTFTSGSGVGGVAVITPSGAAIVGTVALTGQGFQFVAGQKFWYLARFTTSAIAAPSGIVGLQKGTAATRTDGIYFNQAAGGVISLVSVVGSVVTTLVANVATAAVGVYTDAGFYYDGTDLLVFANDKLVARVASPTIGAAATTLSNAIISPVFQITPTASDTMTIDYVLTAQEVVR